MKSTIRGSYKDKSVDDIPKRERVLRRTFKYGVQQRKYSSEEFHAFCNWAKGKSETEMKRLLQ